MGEDSSLYRKFGRTVDPGETIFEEGESGDQMFIIQNGKVRVSKKIGGREHILAVLGKGDFFGEMAIVTNVRRTATVKAATQVELLCFNREGFVSMINKNPKIALNVIDKLCRRVQNSNLQIQHLVKKNGRALVALNLYYAFKEEGKENALLYYDRTVEEISLNLEIPLDTVKGFLQDFERQRIIRVTAKQISLIDIDKLQNITESVTN
jgi:CRP/FNR family cyclic AMP-dependent transcriptional regulator